jgi:hypothetical protein
MVVSEITLFNTLKAKLGEQEAQVIVEGIKQTVREEFEAKRDLLSSKEDIYKLQIEMEKGFRENLKWTVGTVIACSGIIIALIKLL